MSEEAFSTLTPEHGDTPEILRLKLGVAASRLAAVLQDGVAVDLAALRSTVESLLPLVQQLVPLPVAPRTLEFVRTWDPQPFVSVPTYFRKACIWAASLAGVPTSLSVRLLCGTNANRIILAGQMVAIEAPPGLVLNLQDFSMAGGYFYTDIVTVELY